MGAFEQLFGSGRGEFEQKLSKKFKCPGGCPGGMLKPRFDWYINSIVAVEDPNDELTEFGFTAVHLKENDPECMKDIAEGKFNFIFCLLVGRVSKFVEVE